MTLDLSDPHSYAIEIDATIGLLRLHAVSHGCTRAQDFEIVREGTSDTFVVTRLKPDRCRRRPFAVTFEFPLDDIPGAVSA